MTAEQDWMISSANRNIKSGFVELYNSRSVLLALVRRELKSRYRGSFLGFVWVLGKPLSMLLVFTLFIGEILGASRSIEYFALYIFISLMFWGFFSEATVSATNSIVSASGLVQKISFPREILPITSVVIAFVNTLIQVPVLIIGYAIFARWPSPEGLVYLIPIIGILFFLSLSFALILSAVNVYVRDIQPLTELVVMLLMYATPILYSWTFVKERIVNTFGDSSIFDIYVHNPLAVVIIGVQDALWPGQRIYSTGEKAENLFGILSPTIWIIFGFSFLFLLGAYRIFLKLEPNFAREL